MEVATLSEPHSLHLRLRAGDLSASTSSALLSLSLSLSVHSGTMASRQVDDSAADGKSFVDDRCATVWQAPRFSSSPRATPIWSLEHQKHVRSAQAAQNERDAALYTTKPKPLDGNLLKKLFKATMEEKQRASESAAKVKQKHRDELPRTKEDKPTTPPGFHIPPGVGIPRKRVHHFTKEQPQDVPQAPCPTAKQVAKKEKSQEIPRVSSRLAIPTAKKEKSIPATPALSVRSSVTKTNLVRISGSHGEEAFVEIPVSPQHTVAVRSNSAPLPPVVVEQLLGAEEPVGLEEAVGLEEPVMTTTAEEVPDKKLSKKEKRKNKKNQKNQNRYQEAEKQHVDLNPNLDVVNDNDAKAPSNDEHMLMSGALPAMSAIGLDDLAPHAKTPSNGDIQAVIEKSTSTYIVSRRGPSIMQPTVESVASRVSSRKGRASKVASTKVSSIRTGSPKLSSFRSFEEVGEGEAWIGHRSPVVFARSQQSQSASLAASARDFEKLGHRRTESGGTSKVSKTSGSRTAASAYSARSTGRRSSRHVPLPEVDGDRGEINPGSPNTLEDHSIHDSVHSGPHRSSAKVSHSVRENLSRAHSRRSSSRRSSEIRLFNHETRHSSASRSSRHDLKLESSPDGVQSNTSSPRSLRSDSYRNQQPSDGSFVGEQEAEQSHANSKTGSSNAFFPRSEAVSHQGSRSPSNRLSRSSRHSKESSLHSHISHIYSRHASTRSFSPREHLWDGSPSNKSPAESGSLHSSTQHVEVASEHDCGKPSVMQSVMGSVANVISTARSQLTFDEVGDGWHDNGVSSSGLKHKSQKVRSSSTLVLKSLSGDNNDDNWDRVEHAVSKEANVDACSRHSKHSGSKAHSRHASPLSTSRSQNFSVDGRPRTPNHHSKISERSGSTTHVRSLVGVPIRAVISSVGHPGGIISVQENDDVHSQMSDEPQEQRPTVFAGRGWITPHPLESSVTERSPAIVLPSDALANGATLSYEEWKEMQEAGLKDHRNFSMTESNQSERVKHRHHRYRFSGWQEVEPGDPNAASAQPSMASRKPSLVRAVESGSEASSERSTPETLQGRSYHSQQSNRDGFPAVSSSERLWERMEEGEAGHRQSHRDSVVSSRESAHAYSVWSQSHSRRSRSDSRHRE